MAASDINAKRQSAASAANAEDAAVWRWISYLLDERRIRWCLSAKGWLISVDHKHVATDSDFDRAIRSAKSATDVACAPCSDGKPANSAAR
jgi:hypothetical protein